MNKLLWITLSLFLLLSGCVEMDESTLVTDDQGYVHRTIHFLRDKRGREHYPVKIKGTGRRQFVFDPKAYSWAAYDEEGNRVMTGAASGGKDFCGGID